MSEDTQEQVSQSRAPPTASFYHFMISKEKNKMHKEEPNKQQADPVYTRNVDSSLGFSLSSHRVSCQQTRLYTLSSPLSPGDFPHST
jgi:hypothetical protein